MYVRRSPATQTKTMVQGAFFLHVCRFPSAEDDREEGSECTSPSISLSRTAVGTPNRWRTAPYKMGPNLSKARLPPQYQKQQHCTVDMAAGAHPLQVMASAISMIHSFAPPFLSSPPNDPPAQRARLPECSFELGWTCSGALRVSQAREERRVGVSGWAWSKCERGTVQGGEARMHRVVPCGTRRSEWCGFAPQIRLHLTERKATGGGRSGKHMRSVERETAHGAGGDR
ncbi:hypothetical protein B0H19DRAFT_1236298 [Mycena capillaripes]|nr:hypothetical protein B0H19DRAFT_1236298 [Mycena capillaripes]